MKFCLNLTLNSRLSDIYIKPPPSTMTKTKTKTQQFVFSIESSKKKAARFCSCVNISLTQKQPHLKDSIFQDFL